MAKTETRVSGETHLYCSNVAQNLVAAARMGQRAPGDNTKCRVLALHVADLVQSPASLSHHYHPCSCPETLQK